MAHKSLDTKAFGIVDFDIKTPDDDDAPNGSFYSVLSAPTKDRDGEVVDFLAFDPVPDHITIDTDHGLSVSTTVGSGAPQYESDLLTVRGTYSSIPRAQEVRTLVREGHIRKMSVAFMNAVREVDEEDGLTHIRSAELLNAAFVAVPSNREASVLVGKSFEVKASKGERLQQIHDLSVANGATCESKAAPVAESKTPGTDPEEKAAAPAAADPPAEVTPAMARLAALRAEAELLLID